MKFGLKKLKTGKTLTTFAVIDDAGSTRGTINIPTSAEQDLLAHWAGAIGNPPPAKQGMAKALLRNRRQVSKAAILRGAALS
jgi:hypothetical protein